MGHYKVKSLYNSTIIKKEVMVIKMYKTRKETSKEIQKCMIEKILKQEKVTNYEVK